MSSDQRWTGGAANRSWQTGTRTAATVDHQAIRADVRTYLGECRRFHLTATPDMAVSVVWGPADAIREAFRLLTARA